MKYCLVGVDGNAYALIGYTTKAMRREGFSSEEIQKMHKEATASDYNNLVCVCDDYVQKCNERAGDEDEE